MFCPLKDSGDGDAVHQQRPGFVGVCGCFCTLNILRSHAWGHVEVKRSQAVEDLNTVSHYYVQKGF